MTGPQRLLLVDDEHAFADALADGLVSQGYEVVTARSLAEAQACIGEVSLAVVDLSLDDGSGLDLLRLVRSMNIDVEIVVLTGRPELDSAVTALRLGAFHYLCKPVHLQALADVLRQASERRVVRRELERMRTRLSDEARLAALGRVAAGIAHEVNNPIAVVLAGMHAAGRDLSDLERLVADGLSGEARARAEEKLQSLRAIVEDARVAARRVADIVKRVRPLAGAGAGRAMVDAGLVLQAAGDVVRTGQGEAALEWDCGAVMGVIIEANAAELMEVAVHVASNALRAVSAVPSPRVRCRAYADELQLHIEVEDNGRGIDSSHLPLIFDPFFTTAAPGDGVGLGLTVVRELLSRMGGTIEVDTREGQGTTVRVALPRRADGGGQRCLPYLPA